MRAASETDLIPATAAEGEPTWPCPPRYWWLTRLTVATLLLSVNLAGLRMFWGHEASRRLGRELEPILAAGEPVSAPGMNVAPVPDAENGARLYLRALTRFGTDSPAASAMEYSDHPPFPPRWHKMEDKSVATNGEVFRLVREARPFTRFDWGVRMTTPANLVPQSHLNRVRHLANIVSDAALHAHVNGDDYEALERIRDVRHLSSAVDAPPTTLISHLVSIGLDAMAVARLEVIAPGLTIAPEGEESPAPPSTDPTRPARRPATRAQVRALIAELLDESGRSNDLRRAFVAERAELVDIASWFAGQGALVRPMFDLDAVRLARGTSAVVKMTHEPNSQSIKEATRAEPLLQAASQLTSVPGRRITLSDKRPPVDYTRLLSTEFNLGSLTRGVEQDLRVRADRRMVAVSLAAQLYRADHGGAFPPSLDELVPKYLPRVPADPGAADGRPLKYFIARGALPGGGDRPIVYSVGTDGRDNTAEWGANRSGLPAQPRYGFWPGADQWRDLSRWSPAATEVEAANEAKQEKEAEPILQAIDAAAERLSGRGG